MKGRLGKCPSCEGRLKINDDSGDTVVCAGAYFGKMTYTVTCQYTGSVEEAPRFNPFYLEEMTEEEKRQVEDDHGRSLVSTDLADLKSSLIVEASKIDEWDLMTKQGIAAAVSAIINLCRGKLVMPDDDKQAKHHIAPIFTRNRELNPADIMDEVIDLCGFVQTNERKKAAKQKAAIDVCVNPDNADVYQLLLELKMLYAKEGNKVAAKYHKAANAVRKLDYKITKSNAIGLGKGTRTKVKDIGPAIADTIFEFVDTGVSTKLEKKRAEALQE